MQIFNPYDEPEDRYGSNEQGFDWFTLFIAVIPFIGIGAIIGPLMYTRVNKKNRFNLANTAWNSAVAAVVIQSLYVIAFLVGLVVVAS